MIVEKHQLTEVKQVPAAEVGNELAPWLLIIHYTAGQSAAGAISWFQSPRSKVSAHLVVDRDGTITQMVPFNRCAAHAGASRWRGHDGCNRFSIGVELANPGPLRRRSDGSFVDLTGKSWDGGAIEARHKHGHPEYAYWAEFAEPQLAAAREACEAICRAYPIREIVGHDDVAPTRKLDPGPAFPLQTFQNLVAPRDSDGADVYVVLKDLNVRSGPGLQHATVDGSPLAAGRRVLVVDVNGSWWYVHTTDSVVEGWVSRHFLQLA